MMFLKKVRVYWNLHSKIWSVQDSRSGLVIDHVSHISLEDAKFVVRKGGQERVRREGKKNVHAFAVGYITVKKLTQIYYHLVVSSLLFSISFNFYRTTENK